MGKVSFVSLLIASSFLVSFQFHPRSLESFDNVVYKVNQAYANKDANTLNELVDPQHGILFLFRRGTFDEYEKAEGIDFTKPVPEYLPYDALPIRFTLNYEGLPSFDCDSMIWSKSGLYCDTSLKDNLLSTIAANLKKNRGDNIPDSEIKAFKDLEKKSRRIVLSDGKKGELIFYLSFINKKWYLTIIDRVSSDCGV